MEVGLRTKYLELCRVNEEYEKSNINLREERQNYKTQY
jgi:hypothetical protein